MRLPEWLHQRAELTPDRLAVVEGTSRLTFRELDRWVDAIAARLRDDGVRQDDRVALLMRNSAAYVAIVHAVARVGAVLVPLNTRLTAAEIAFQLGDASPGLLLYDASTAATAADVTSGPSAPIARSVEQIAAGASAVRAARPPPIELDRVHSIVYTSGTTGTPKGAQLTFGNHWWSAIGSALNLGLSPDDRWLACLPLFHVGGLAIVLRSVVYGIAAVVQTGFDPRAVNRAIDEDGITIVSVVAAMLRRMLDERDGQPYPATLRCALLGGGPAPAELLAASARLGLPVVQTYGLSEAASQVATLAPEDALPRLGSAGKPLFPTEVQIAVDAGPAAPGEVGEILVRGPTVTRGYLNRPDATAQALRDGWLHTGDLGYLDDEGFLYVVDRRDDLIVSGGENVYPAEVEAALLAHPDVIEAGVTGVPHELWGRAVLAAVKLRDGAAITPAELAAHCRARLAGYKVPAEIRLVEAVPRNAAGKILRRRIAEG